MIPLLSTTDGVTMSEDEEFHGALPNKCQETVCIGFYVHEYPTIDTTPIHTRTKKLRFP